MPREQEDIGRREIESSSHCYLCNVEFLPEDWKVIDHDHFSGKYLGIAHNKCNLQGKARAEMTVFFHANYDFVQLPPKFFKDLGIEVIVDGILKAGEKFMALSLALKLAKVVKQKIIGGKKKVSDFIFTINFRDSLSSLGGLSKKLWRVFPRRNL